MAPVTNLQQIWGILVNTIADVIGGKITFLLPDPDINKVIEAASSPAGTALAIARWMVTLRGEELKLTPIEYEILKYMALQADRVVTHWQLLRAIWGPNHPEHTHYLLVYIG
jgi:DNA-binding response OmpR family regulator